MSIYHSHFIWFLIHSTVSVLFAWNVWYVGRSVLFLLAPDQSCCWSGHFYGLLKHCLHISRSCWWRLCNVLQHVTNQSQVRSWHGSRFANLLFIRFFTGIEVDSFLECLALCACVACDITMNDWVFRVMPERFLINSIKTPWHLRHINWLEDGEVESTPDLIRANSAGKGGAYVVWGPTCIWIQGSTCTCICIPTVL